MDYLKIELSELIKSCGVDIAMSRLPSGEKSLNIELTFGDEANTKPSPLVV